MRRIRAKRGVCCGRVYDLSHCACQHGSAELPANSIHHPHLGLIWAREAANLAHSSCRQTRLLIARCGDFRISPSPMSSDIEDDKKSDRNSKFAEQRRAFRDAKRARAGLPPLDNTGKTRPPRRGSLFESAVEPDTIHLYGLHTVRAALDNPRRSISKLMVSQNAAKRLEIEDLDALPFDVEVCQPSELDKLLGDDTVHQGALLVARPLSPRPLSALKDTQLVVILDQVTDPHNVGAIIRSAVAFGAGALITTQRHSPSESGVLAKSASGALELIDMIEERNLADAIETIKAQGFQAIGLDSDAPEALEDTFRGERIALVLGAEGKGLRQKTRSVCSDLARLDMPGEIKSLNVSNATAIALYAARKHLKSL